MSHYPLRSLEDLADPSHATFVADQSVHDIIDHIWLLRANKVLQSTVTLRLHFVLIYDHRLTLETEVKLMWSAKLRPGTYWFFAVRYIALSANIGVAVFNFSNLPHEVTLIEATLSIRVFAMYGRNIWVLVCLLSAICVIGTLGLWASITFGKHANIPAVPGLAGCHEIYANANSLRSMYFGLMVLANLANVLTYYLGDGLIAGFLSWFTTSLSVALLSRLMLNLHEAGVAQLATDPVDTTKVQFMEMGRASIDDTLDTEIIQFTEMGSTSIDDESRSKTQAM
ncbi:hypothetical protein B0H14DRAFT_3787532 [Mycena olivaceomarginata]|nr:hypothetical protein B0H14DRAFT_3787532 [Mycena olivaceomarginata]